MIHAEQVLLGHLSDPDSLEHLSSEGFHQAVSLATIPTELVREMTAWAINYYWENGRKVGPSQEAILAVWGDRMEALEVELPDPTVEIDSVEWAVQAIRAQYAVSQSQKLIREAAAAVSKAGPTEKVDIVMEIARNWHALGQALSSRRSETTLSLGFEDALMRHEDRRTNGHRMHGMTLGLPLIDDHILGIHPGEMAVFAMTSGGGKSWFAARTLLNCWKRGRRGVLVTLENDLDMTFDRLVCIHARVDYEKWQKGEATDDEVYRVLVAKEEIEATDHEPVVTMLQPGEMDPLSIVRRCHTVGGEDLIVDQLSYIEKVPGSKSRERHQIVGEILRELRACIKDDAAGKLPMLLMAQINRAGREAARKTGRYEFEHLGLSTEVENIADFVWAPYQSDEHRIVERAVWQELKFRRGRPTDFDMRWRLSMGDIRALNPVEEQTS
jgi:replicative DNA helicase